MSRNFIMTTMANMAITLATTKNIPQHNTNQKQKIDKENQTKNRKGKNKKKQHLTRCSFFIVLRGRFCPVEKIEICRCP